MDTRGSFFRPVTLACCVGIAGLLVIAGGCDGLADKQVAKKAPAPALIPAAVDSPTGEPAEVPTAVRQALDRIGSLQAHGLDDATVKVHRAYISPDDAYRIKPEYRDDRHVVVVDVTFDGFSYGFDLDDVDVINADSKENHGSDPLLFGVLPDGQVCHINDPEVLGKHYRHVLLCYSLPRTCRAIALEYWEKPITSEPIVLESTGPALPKGERVEACEIWPAGRASETFDRVLARVVVSNAYRTESFSHPWKLVGAEETSGAVDRLLEIDESGEPAVQGQAGRPPIVPTRWLLIEFWLPRGMKAERLSYGYLGEESAVTDREVEIPAETLAALAARPIHESAHHRTIEERFGKRESRKRP